MNMKGDNLLEGCTQPRSVTSSYTVSAVEIAELLIGDVINREGQREIGPILDLRFPREAQSVCCKPTELFIFAAIPSGL